MKPYYVDSSQTIFLYHGDCREVINSLPVDDYITIADPPYGETKHKWDTWPVGWPRCVEAVSKSMWCFGSFRMFMKHWPEFEQFSFSQDVVWEKHNGTGSHRDRFRRIHELACFFWRSDVPWKEIYAKVPVTMDAKKKRIQRHSQPPNWATIGAGSFLSEDGGPRMMTSVLYVRSCHGHAIHPTQKPEGLVRPLMDYCCPPDGIILDVFTGSGTVLRVAKDTGRRAIGIEADEAMCEKAARRLEQEVIAV